MMTLHTSKKGIGMSLCAMIGQVAFHNTELILLSCLSANTLLTRLDDSHICRVELSAVQQTDKVPPGLLTGVADATV